MIGLFLGSCCGVFELVLLTRLVRNLSTGTLTWWLLPAKVFALALFFIPCAIWIPAQLSVCGIAAASVLIVGSVVQLIWNRKKVQTTEITEEGNL